MVAREQGPDPMVAREQRLDPMVARERELVQEQAEWARKER